VEQVIDMLGLMGDASDNIPGIPGVGEKTAAKLLKLYDTLEGVLENADKITGAMGEKVRAGKASAIMSKKLATIITDVPVQFHEEDFRLKEKNSSALAEIFNELEFKTLGKRILGDAFSVTGNVNEEKNEGSFSKPDPNVNGQEQTDLFGNTVNVKPPKQRANKTTASEETADTEDNSEDNDFGGNAKTALVVNKNINNTEHDYKSVVGDKEIEELVETLLKQNEICIDTETTGVDANNVSLVGLSFSYKEHEGYFLPIENDGDGKTGAKYILKKLQPLFDNVNITWIGQNLKYDFLVLKWYSVELKGKTFDTMLAHYVIEPEGRRGMDLLSAQFLGYEPVSITSIIGKKGKNQGSMRDAPLEQITQYAAEDADITLQLKNCFAPLILKRDVSKVFNEVENPLVRVLVDMEYEGVKVDTQFLSDYSKVLEVDAKISEERVYEQAGVRFNLASPKQLGEVLFEILKLDAKAKKTKTGQYATGEDVLQKMAAKHKIVDDILNFRELTKLKSTYVDSVPALINPKTGRIHTSYAQAVAVTGRLSSTNPNLQNIPIRTERGREIRKAFIPRDPSRVLISADYSQIELRIVAAISGDPNMCDAFKQGKDIHTATAAKVYGIEESAVTKEMRYKAKSVNFGIIYGQGAFGLAENLGIPRAEAKEIIDNYKKEFPNIQLYMDQQINHAKEVGYVETLMGRKRWLRDINSSNFTVRGFAERNAINSPIQGSAADMIKLAMIKIHAEMKKSSWQSKMILQVHDELVFDATEKEVPALKELILDCMKSAMVLPNGVPVEAEVGVGKNWLEAH
jgi:DNA polymerase-1